MRAVTLTNPRQMAKSSEKKKQKHLQNNYTLNTDKIK